MTINELKEMQSNFEQAITEQSMQAAAQDDKAAVQLEAARRLLKQEEERSNKLVADLAASQKQLRYP